MKYNLNLLLAPLLVIAVLLPVRFTAAESENSVIPEDDIVQLEQDMDLIQLIETVSNINNETYILDESVKPQEITIITPDGGMKKEDFLRFFEVILNMNGLSVVKSGDVNKVISSNRIKEENTPTIVEPEK